ncbi:unnamed protein product [Lampetra fluviatilis]
MLLLLLRWQRQTSNDTALPQRNTRNSGYVAPTEAHETRFVLPTPASSPCERPCDVLRDVIGTYGVKRCIEASLMLTSVMAPDWSRCCLV